MIIEVTKEQQELLYKAIITASLDEDMGEYAEELEELAALVAGAED